MSTPTPIHIPVMMSEIITWLEPSDGRILADGTLGGGGHTAELARRVGPSGRVLAIDRDPAAVRSALERLHDLPIDLRQANFCDLPEVLEVLEVEAVDGIVLDLGLSSDQLADHDRGFSYAADGSLDLRFNTELGEPAYQLLGRLSEKNIADLIYNYGEERFSRRIAKRIVERRKSNPVKTAGQLADLIRSCVPRSKGHNIDPATRTFQALRIAVNEELKSLEIALRRLPDCLKPGGRIAIISFHSLEDRLVKNAFRDDERIEVLTRKPIRPSEEEISRNPRSRSAKLRVGARIAPT